MKNPNRVISLIASGTEIVSALGYQHCLAGRSHECDYPPSVQGLPVCSEPRVDLSGNSEQIDRQVRDTVRDVLSVYSVFQHELERLQPTVIITQAQCDVCAVNVRDVEAAVADLLGQRPEIVSLEPMQLEDIWADVMRVAAALGDKKSGEDLVRQFKRRLADLRALNRPEQAPTVLCVEWLKPLMSAANWVPELVQIAGGQAVLCETGQHSQYITWRDIEQADPDVIAIMPCGFDVERTLSEMHLLLDEPAWKELRAVRDGRVYITNGNHFFNRPGPRIVESAEIIHEILHCADNVPGNHERWIPFR